MSNKNASLTTNVHYKDDTFKLFIQEEEMYPDSNYHSVQHIHPELEIMLITEGYLYYHINGKDIKVTKNQVIYVNSNQMHASHLKESSYCKFIVLLIHPTLFSSNAYIYTKYARPIIENQNLDYFLFSASNELQNIFCTMLKNQSNKSKGYQLSLIGDAYHILQQIYIHSDIDSFDSSNQKSEDITSLNQMTTFIYHSYADKISLNDIAQIGNVSISKCSRIFKHYMHHSPIDFLNLHRLEVASNLLRNTNQSILDISLSCGFDQQSYFNRMFKKEYGCTPLKYRKSPVDQFVH